MKKIRKRSLLVVSTLTATIGLAFFGGNTAYAEDTRTDDEVLEDYFRNELNLVESPIEGYYTENIPAIQDNKYAMRPTRSKTQGIYLNLEDVDEVDTTNNTFYIKRDFKKYESFWVYDTLNQVEKFSQVANGNYSLGKWYDELKTDIVGYKVINTTNGKKVVESKVSTNGATTGTSATGSHYGYSVITQEEIKAIRFISKNRTFDSGSIKKGVNPWDLIAKYQDKSMTMISERYISLLTSDKKEFIVLPFYTERFYVGSDKSKGEDINNEYLDELEKAAQQKPISANQDIKANILNGGITGGIVSPEAGKDLAIQDVDFGNLKVGETILPQEKTDMISVRDWTGGNGWKLTAKHKDLERNKSLQLGVAIEEDTEIQLNDNEQLITTGVSQLETTKKDGKYTAKWGTHPTVGEFNNVIEWNLSANVTE